MTESKPAGTMEMARVAFKAPPFWESDPDFCFSQVESQFIIAGITEDKTKFHAVVASLDVNVLSSIRDIVLTPPTRGVYPALRKGLLERFSQTETARLKLLLQDLRLGNRTPSQLLLEMQTLADGKMDDDLLRTLWLQRLPVNFQQILSICSDSLANLAVMAGKINEFSACSSAIAALTVEHSEATELQKLRDDVAKLTAQVSRLISRTPRSPRRRSRARNASNSSRHASRDARGQRENGLCWYHRRFASRARKCVSPCAWSENTRASP